jgi:hypothetical protein
MRSTISPAGLIRIRSSAFLACISLPDSLGELFFTLGLLSLYSEIVGHPRQSKSLQLIRIIQDADGILRLKDSSKLISYSRSRSSESYTVPTAVSRALNRRRTFAFDHRRECI